MPVRIPDLLKPHGRIALISPSSKVDPEVAQAAVSIWRNAGYEPVLYPSSLAVQHNYAGTDDQRLRDFQAALDDDSIQVIHCLRGGYGLTRYLDQLDFTRFLQKPKWLVGFSDITAALLALMSKGVACIHGPMASHIRDPKVWESLITFLVTGNLSVTWKDGQRLPDATLVGEVVGGNLTLLCHSLGSQFELRVQNKVLFLEEVGEQLYHTDRMLLQLRRAGKLDGLAGLVVGQFTEVKDSATPFGQSIEQIIMDHAGRYGYPIWFGYPAGHHNWNLPLPMGVPVHIDRKQGSCRLACSIGKSFV